MRVVDAKNIEHSLKRELARRHFEALAPAERDAEIDKHLVNISVVAVEDLIRTVTGDPFQEEVQRRHFERVASKIAGDNATPLVRLLSRSVALMVMERDLADVRFFKLLQHPDRLEFSFTRAWLRWRDFAHRKLNSAIRTLAYVRRVDVLDVENTIDRFRIAG
jgi:hypothetical protein